MSIGLQWCKWRKDVLSALPHARTRQWPDTHAISQDVAFSHMLFVVRSERWDIRMCVCAAFANAFAGRSESFSVGDFIIHIHLAGTRVWRVERDIWGNLKTLTQLLRAERQPEIARPTSMSELAAYMRNPRKPEKERDGCGEPSPVAESAMALSGEHGRMRMRATEKHYFLHYTSLANRHILLRARDNLRL